MSQLFFLIIFFLINIIEVFTATHFTQSFINVNYWLPAQPAQFIGQGEYSDFFQKGS